MKNKFDEERLKEMTLLVGAFISAVRRTGKVPAIFALHKSTLNRGCDAGFARKFKVVMEQTVAHVDGNSAKLYRDNRTVNQVMPLVEETWFKTSIPEPVQRRTRKPKAVQISVSEEPMKDTRPVQESSPKGLLYSCDGTLDFTSHNDEDLTAIAFAIQKELEARAAKRAAQAKLQTVLEQTEMSKEELLDLLNII